MFFLHLFQMVLGFSQGKFPPNPNPNPSPNPIWGVTFLGRNYPDTVSDSFSVHTIGDMMFQVLLLSSFIQCTAIKIQEIHFLKVV